MLQDAKKPVSVSYCILYIVVLSVIIGPLLLHYVSVYYGIAPKILHTPYRQKEHSAFCRYCMKVIHLSQVIPPPPALLKLSEMVLNQPLQIGPHDFQYRINPQAAGFNRALLPEVQLFFSTHQSLVSSSSTSSFFLKLETSILPVVNPHPRHSDVERWVSVALAKNFFLLKMEIKVKSCGLAPWKNKVESYVQSLTLLCTHAHSHTNNTKSHIVQGPVARRAVMSHFSFRTI